MKVLERRLLRGPNVHSPRPCLLAVLDLGALDDVSSAAIDGFVDRLLGLVPTLWEHRCSPGYPGGFVERLREGTYMAHIVEHVTLELQCLAGHDVGFGKARKVRGQPRQYRIVVSYKGEDVAGQALDDAIDLVEAVAAGEPFDLQPRLQTLRTLAARTGIGPSTRAIVEAAEQRGIPVVRLTESASLFQLGWGSRQQRIQAALTSRTSHIAVGIASDKALTKRLLEEAGLPVPRGRVVSRLDGAEQAMAALRGLVVVKPLDGNQGKGVTTGIRGADGLATAFERARAFSRRVIVEQHVEGDDYRVLVIGHAVVAASRRVPPEVTGDGRTSVRELVAAVNRDPRRGDGHENALTKIRLDAAADEELARQGLVADDVPEAGRRVRLRGNANLSTGGTAEDVTARLHPDTAQACVRAAQKIGLDVAGIDLVCRDIAQPLGAQRGALIEVNAAPGIRMHEHPSQGERHHVGRAIVGSLFAHGSDGRIPVVAVTGTNGKTTTVLAIDHVMRSLGRSTGVTTTEGIFIDGRPVKAGDCTGYWSARTVLSSPSVDFAVLETARGGILKRGLAFDRCDVAVVLNIGADHLGQDGVESVEDLARVKGLLVETARVAVVLNAEDPLCATLRRRARRGVEVVYFSQDPAHPTFAEHLRRGGRGVCERRGQLVWADGSHEMRLCASAELPFTLQGRARHNVANAMAVLAALVSLDVAPERVVAGLAGFTSSESQNPMRLNVYESAGVTLLLDYAHNAAAYRAIAETARTLTRGRLVGVVAAPGDRRDDDLLAVGRACAEGFDALVVYEMDDKRGRTAGACAEVVARGATGASSDLAPAATATAAPPVQVVLDVHAAVRTALQQARPGDVVVIGCASHLSDLKVALGSDRLLQAVERVGGAGIAPPVPASAETAGASAASAGVASPVSEPAAAAG